MKSYLWAIAGAALAAAPAMAASGANPAPIKAVAEIMSLTGDKIGSAVFKQTPKGVQIQVTAHGLPPGVHALHIHTTGKCDATSKFASAGGHFNPTAKTHGSMSMDPEHAGDMPNQTVSAKGELKATVLDANLSVASLFDADGSAIVIHAMPDDYMTQPTGNAGDRIACGVIEKAGQ